MYQFLQTIILFLLFAALSLLILYVSGFAVVANIRKRLEDQEIVVLALSLGIIIFTLTAIIFALLKIRFLILPAFILTNLFLYLKYKLDIFAPWKIFIRNKLLLLLITIGILIQGFINFPSGYLYKEGLYFWSSQGHDGIWHVALMEEIKINIPPKNPIFAGESLYNYHYFVDVLMGEFNRIFPFFSALDLYFRFFPVIFSLLIGLSVFAFMSRWQKSKQIGYLGVFFTYFVGSFGYLVTFARSGNLFDGETMFWASQQNTLLGNPPHAISHGLLVSFFLAFLLYLNERKFIFLVVSFLLVSTLAGFKVLGAFVMLVGIGAAAIVDLINKRKFSTVGLALILGITNFLTFKSMTSKEATSFLMFLPWWFIRTMIVDKLGWINMELARQHYVSKGTWHAWLRVVQLESYALLIFILGNLGMRCLGLYTVVKGILSRKAFKDPIEAMLITTGLTGLLMVIFFVQKGIVYNNIQFIQYFLLIVGFYGAITLFNLVSLFKNKWLKFCLLTVVIILSIPTVIGNLNEFYGGGKTALAEISNQTIEALQFLKQNSKKEAVILTMPFNKYLKDKFPYQPRPIYAWYSTAYIPALTGRSIYLTSEEQALITGYPIEERLPKMQKFFEQSDFSFNRQFLKDNNISLIYIAKSEVEKPLDVKQNNLEVFFENNEVIIYKTSLLFHNKVVN